LVGAAHRDMGWTKGGRECAALSGQIVARLPYLAPKNPEGEQRQADRLLKCGQVMKEDPFWALMGDAYDGLKEAGEAVNIKAGRAAYCWFHQRIKKLQLAGGPDTRYRDSTVELDESLSPGVMVLSAGGESCTLVLTA
jgi:hypothetical protein